MLENVNLYLLMGGLASGSAAILHLAIVIGGAPWYQAFGASRGIIAAAAAGQWSAPLTVLGIASVLAAWSAYALSGAGLLMPLPFSKLILVLIALAYLLRASAGGVALFTGWGGLSRAFIAVSSLVCLGIGLLHAKGLAQAWPSL